MNRIPCVLDQRLDPERLDTASATDDGSKCARDLVDGSSEHANDVVHKTRLGSGGDVHDSNF